MGYKERRGDIMEKICRQSKGHERVEIEGRALRLPPPADIHGFKFVGRENIMEKALSAWTSFNGRWPLNFRLYGPPGVGKNAIVYELARMLNKGLYIMNGNEELDAEDIACTPVMTAGGRIEYSASPLFAAMLKGGIAFIDEIGKAPAGALSSLASVLDDRRSLSSMHAGIEIKANEGFLFCCALNDTEEEGIGLPPFLDERTRPAIHIGYPSAAEMKGILESHFLGEDDLWVDVFMSEFNNDNISPRCARDILQYAINISKRRECGVGRLTKKETGDLFYSLLKDMRIEKKEVKQVKQANSGLKEDLDAVFKASGREKSVH